MPIYIYNLNVILLLFITMDEIRAGPCYKQMKQLLAATNLLRVVYIEGYFLRFVCMFTYFPTEEYFFSYFIFSSFQIAFRLDEMPFVVKIKWLNQLAFRSVVVKQNGDL